MFSNKRNLALLILVLSFTFFIVNEVSTFYFAFEKEKNIRYENNKKTLDNLSEHHKNNVNLLAIALSNNPVVKEAYEQDDPELIKEHITPIWHELKKLKLVYEIHFFKPPAISFVNFSNFNSLGEDVSDVRKDIEWVTSSFKSSTHTMVCKTYPGFIATHPIVSDSAKMLGGLSMGKKIDWLPEVLKEYSGDESFLVYKKSVAKSLAKEYYDSFISDKELFGQYILAERTLPVSFKDLKNIDLEAPVSELTIDGKEFILYSYPIKDFNKNIMGYVYTLNDFQSFYDKFKQRILRNFIIILFTAFFIYLLVFGRLQRMIAQSKYLSYITQQIKDRNFFVIKEQSKEDTLFRSGEVLESVKNDILDMSKTIEQKYTSLESQLVEQLYTDSLTKLPNRNALMRDIKMSTHSLIIINIRSFKQINDAFGFQTGDKILINFGKKLKEISIQENFNSYHLGGDEFVVMQNSFKKEMNRIDIINSMFSKLEKLSIYINQDLSVHINIYAGVSFSTDNQLVKADMALAQAKKTCKTYSIYTDADNTQKIHEANFQMTKIIKHAIESKQVKAFYQPILDVKTQKILKYEALMRIVTDKKVLVPFDFLELSKQTMQYHQLSKLIIQQALDTIKQNNIAVSINLTALDISNDDTVSYILNTLENFEECDNVIFELTETDNLYGSNEVKEFLQKISLLGAKIAIDDFGTGYSNFSYLVDLDPDYLKIDGSLIKNIDTDRKSRTIVTSIVEFAKELNIKTIAEYVHNQKVLDVCQEIGVDELQGYFIGKPDAEIKL